MDTSEDQYKLLFKNESETKFFAFQLAKIIQPKDVIALNGDLGTGKTVFARAFVEAVTGEVEVPSPTFTLLQSYEGVDVTVYHFDLYRIEDPNEVFELGIEEAFSDGVSIIEWPDRMAPYLPNQRLEIYLSNGCSNNAREFQILAVGEKWKKKLAILDL